MHSDNNSKYVLNSKAQLQIMIFNFEMLISPLWKKECNRKTDLKDNTTLIGLTLVLEGFEWNEKCSGGALVLNVFIETILKGVLEKLFPTVIWFFLEVYTESMHSYDMYFYMLKLLKWLT